MGRANVRALCTLVMVGTAALGMWACPSNPPIESPESSLMLTASPKTLLADGTTTDLSVVAVEASGASGTGQVTISAPCGSLGSANSTEVLLNLSNGHASVKYSCNAAKESACVGTQQVTASWKDATSTTKVTFAGAITPDAGHPADGGVSDAGGTDAGGTDAGGIDAGARDAGSSIDAAYVVTVSAAKANIYSRVGDSTAVTAKVAKGDAGVAGETITLTTNLGGLYIPSDGGVPRPTASLDLTSDSTGAVTARFGDDKTTGPAIITAMHKDSGASAMTTVNILAVSTITYKGMTCNGNPCTMLGLNGSGWNEKGDVSFQVLDANSKPISGVPVTFDANRDRPTGTTFQPTGVTDSLGNVSTQVSSGQSIGIITIQAIVIADPASPVQAMSTPIGVRGAKPTSNNSQFLCKTINLSAYVSNTPPAILSVSCTIKLQDRFNNPVGTGANVYFKTEAGSVPNSVKTKEFVPGGDNNSEGVAEIAFSTNGGFPPVDVPPLEADPNQWPRPREAEPRIATSGDLVANPRDGLVTLLAYTSGQEFFYDTNANGTYDDGETFIDESTPFVDTNDNGTFEPELGDVAVATFAAPNGKWDKDTTIWLETRILYTGRPIQDSSYSFLSPPDFTIEKGADQIFSLFFADRNLNVPAVTAAGLPSGYSLFISSLNTYQSTLSAYQQTDTYGFDIESKKELSVQGEKCCKAVTDGCKQQTPICMRKYLFHQWDAGRIIKFTVTNLSRASDPPAPVAMKVESSVGGTKWIVSAHGTLK